MLCICKGTLNSIRKADCTAPTLSGTLSMNNSQNLSFITTYMAQFHNTANCTKYLPGQFLPTHTWTSITVTNENKTEFRHTLQLAMIEISNWFQSNRLTLNYEKTRLLHFVTKKQAEIQQQIVIKYSNQKYQ